MIGMMNVINKSFFAGRQVVTCYSCHRGGPSPKVTPNLAALYSPPPENEPDDIVTAGMDYFDYQVRVVRDEHRDIAIRTRGHNRCVGRNRARRCVQR